jgi:hypothetical protein
LLLLLPVSLRMLLHAPEHSWAYTVAVEPGIAQPRQVVHVFSIDD